MRNQVIFCPFHRYFSALRGNLYPVPTFGGSLLSLLQPLRVPSRTPFPTFGGSLSSLLQRLRGPSPFFVALRGYLFAFSWKSFLPLATSGGSLLSLLQPLSGPSSSFVPLRGYLFWAFWITLNCFRQADSALHGIQLNGWTLPPGRTCRRWSRWAARGSGPSPRSGRASAGTAPWRGSGAGPATVPPGGQRLQRLWPGP